MRTHPGFTPVSLILHGATLALFAFFFLCFCIEPGDKPPVPYEGLDVGSDPRMEVMYADREADRKRY